MNIKNDGHYNDDDNGDNDNDGGHGSEFKWHGR